MIFNYEISELENTSTITYGNTSFMQKILINSIFKHLIKSVFSFNNCTTKTYIDDTIFLALTFKLMN